MNRLSTLLLIYVVLCGQGLARADVYRIDQRSQWQEWDFPDGTLQLRPDGSMQPMEFEGREINAAPDAPNFSHRAEGEKTVFGGVKNVRSNPAAAANLIDGNTFSIWQPDPEDPLEDWAFEIDLGRAVPVTKIRLVFPDREGARPFSEFRVFGTSGEKVLALNKDIFDFYLVGGTTRPSDERVVEYEVKPVATQVFLNIGEADSGAADDSEITYSLLQYIRFRADAQNPDAALAEVEVYTFGQNIAMGTVERGGSIADRSGNGIAMLDGDVNTAWAGRYHAEDGEANWVWDLGSLFWLKRIAVFAVEDGNNTYGAASGIQNHQFLASDGRRNLTAQISYDQLSELDIDFANPGQLAYLFTTPRPLRYLSSIYTGNSGIITEVAAYPTGFVAQVDITSGNIDLGSIAGDNSPKVIEAVEWEADLPEGTQIQMRTRSGNTLEEAFIYYKKGGTEITQQEYDKLPKPLKGEKIPIIRQGEDWSSWSTFSQVSGGSFRSPSPRQYVQIELRLSSERIDAAPTLKSLAVHYSAALLAGSVAQIFPREAVPGVPQTFSYRIHPQFGAGDDGFDRILFETPSPIDPDSLLLAVAGTVVEPVTVQILPDSLVLQFPEVIRRDSIEVKFRLSVSQNPTVFRAFLGNSRREGLWQPVDPGGRFATTVFLPSVPHTDQLLADLTIQPRVISPNGDGIAERAVIRFLTPKALWTGQVRVYTLDGQLVQDLREVPGPDQSRLFHWSGRDRSGITVAPGNYLCRISMDAQTGNNAVARIISVAY